MSISFYSSGKYSRNLGHFASMVNMATLDGELSPEEETMLKRFAHRLDITETEYKEVLKNPKSFPLDPPNSAEERLERMHDLFQIIYADHKIDEEERRLIEKYAIGLGYSTEQAHKLIERSVEIYSKGFSFDDYRYLINKKN